jgi:hypothetical protein
MSYQQKNIYISLITSIIVFALYGFYMFKMYQEGSFDGTDASSIVGKSIFVMIGASIVVTIIMHIIFAIIIAIITKEEDENTMSDERDKLIELKGLQIFVVTFSIGFVGSMGALALGMESYLVFFLIIFSMFFGNIVSDISKLFFYHRGF